MKQLYSAGVVVYRMGDNSIREYLLLHYPHGHWGLPKGKIEEGENKQEAALRELYEETGLEVQLYEGFVEEISYIFTDFDGQSVRKTVYFFIGQVSYEQSKVTISHEHINYLWLPFEQAIERITYKNDREVLRKAEIFIDKH